MMMLNVAGKKGGAEVSTTARLFRPPRYSFTVRQYTLKEGTATDRVVIGNCTLAPRFPSLVQRSLLDRARGLDAQLDSMVHKTFSVFAPELFAENVFSTDYAALAFLLRVRRPLHSKCVFPGSDGFSFHSCD